MNVKKRVKTLVKCHGSYRKAAAHVGISYAQLFKLGAGQQANPTMDTLRKLGLA